MSLPTITVRIAFATDPLAATPTWTDVSSYVRALRIRRGRQDELNRVEAGTAEVVLDNRDRRFDPTYTSGPYYPNVVPMRKINTRATWSGTTYDLYTGYVEAWPPDWPLSDDSSVTLPCVDGFTYFAHTTLSYAMTSAASGRQIKGTMGIGSTDGILAQLSWPESDQSVNTGISVLQGWTMTNETVLQRLQLITESENGFLWMGADGKIWYRERHWRLNNTASQNSTGAWGGSATSQGTFGDVSPELPYTEIAPSFDDSQIYNDVHITRLSGSEQVVQDTASQNRYFKRSLIKSGLLISTDNESSDAAHWLLAQYKDVALRFKRITIDPQANDSSLWPHALGRDLHDRITIKRRPPGGGAAISQDCFIESIEHVAIAGPQTSWTTSWDLSPAAQNNFFVLDSASNGILDHNVLAY